MKSREEYQKSIFAKRDALLEKRRKNITKALAGTVTAVLLTFCVVALPRINKNLQLESIMIIPSQTQTTAVSETEKTAFGMIFSTNDNIGTINSGNIPETEAAAESVEETTKKSTMPAIQTAEEKSPDTDGIDSAEAVEESEHTEPDGSDYTVTPEMFAEPSFSAEQIAEAAFGFLSPEQQSECIDPTEPEIISAASASESFYLVNFRTGSEKTYQVKLNQNGLELVEINVNSEKEERTAEEPLTRKPGYKKNKQ